MQLEQKGQAAAMEGARQFLITLRWTTAADFDLAAMYETSSGRIGMVYFGMRGDLNSFPYMQLSGDEGVGDTGGDNEEQMRITRLDEMKRIWLLCWDFGMVSAGAPARFHESDVRISVTDDLGRSYDVALDEGSAGNIAVVALIDNAGPQVQFVNTSKTGVLRGFSRFDQILEVIRG